MWDVIQELLITLLLVFKALLVATFQAAFPKPYKSVNGDKILITGGGSGIGQLMALDLAKRGATIISWDISEKGNEETARLVRATGSRVHTYICDVSNKDAVAKVAEQVKADVGDVTILINNAGIVTGKNFMDCSDEELIRTMKINVHAHFWTVRNFLPSMIAHNHGHIVTIASMAGLIGVNGLVDYCTAKFANVGFSETLSLELEKDQRDGITFTTVCPYTITTGLFKGVKSRFPSIIPDLTPEYAAQRIVQALLTNQRLLLMPRIMYILFVAKAVLPVDASLALNKFFGGLNFMEDFVGRDKKR